MRTRLAMLCALGGCDWALGLEPGPDVNTTNQLDIDRDGVPDVDDDCLASPEDAAGDRDGDGRNNGTDACPFDDGDAMSPDSDGDALPDVCDPFSSAGDRSRCVMTFARTDLTAALWGSRGGELPWVGSPNLLKGIAGPTETATVIASQSIEGVDTTTYHALFEFDARMRPGSITLWLRADPVAPSTADIGCRYASDAMSDRVGVIGPTGLADVKITDGNQTRNTLRLTGSLVRTGPVTAVICGFVLNNNAVVESTTNVPLAPGRAGFGVEHWEGQIDGLHVLDRP